MKLSQPIDIAITAMQVLAIDPNFLLMCEIMKDNDMTLLAQQLVKRKDLDGNPLTTQQLEEMSYRHGVMEEMIAMPRVLAQWLAKVQSAKEKAGQPKSTRIPWDPYMTVEDLSK